MNTWQSSVTYFTALIAIGLSHSAFAQTPASVPSHGTYVSVEEADANIGTGFDSNVFRTRDADQDFYYKGEATLGVGAKSGLIPWSFSGKIEDKRFLHFDRESLWDSFLNAKASYKLTHNWSLSLLAGHDYDHIDRENPSTHHADTQARIARTKGSAIISYDSKKWSNTFTYRVQDLDYRGVSFEGNAINTEDEDRVEQEVEFDSSYELYDSFTPKLEIKLSDGSYDTEVDDGGFGRDTQSLVALMGGEFVLSDALQGEALFGPAVTEFEEKTFDDFTSVAWEALLQWHEKNSKHKFSFVTQREFKVTNVLSASGYFQMVYQLTYEYQVIDPLTLALQASYLDINFRGLDLELDDVGLTPSVEYQILKSLVGRFEYNWKERSSNSPGSEFEAHQVFGSLRYNFL